MFLNKLQYLSVNRKISTDIPVLQNPPLHVRRLSAFLQYNAYCCFRSRLIIRAIIGNCRDGVTVKSLFRFLFNWISDVTFDNHALYRMLMNNRNVNNYSTLKSGEFRKSQMTSIISRKYFHHMVVKEIPQKLMKVINNYHKRRSHDPPFSQYFFCTEITAQNHPRKWTGRHQFSCQDFSCSFILN